MGDDRDTILGNDQAFGRLRDTLASGNAIGFVGAGASAGLYPLWHGLMRELADAAIAVPVITKSEHDYWLSDEPDPQASADFIRQRLGGRYPELLRRLFAPRQAADGHYCTAVHRFLMQLPFCGFVTTNYDPGLLEARKIERPVSPGTGFATWADRDSVHLWSTWENFSSGACPVLFAHGHYERSDTIILGAGEYRRAYANGSPFLQLMKDLFRNKCLVFVGFGFSDQWLKFIADNTFSESGSRDLEAPRHFALLGLSRPDFAAPRRQYFNNTYHADPVFYNVTKDAEGAEDHSELLGVLRRLIVSIGAQMSASASNIKTPQEESRTSGLFGGNRTTIHSRAAITINNAHDILVIESLENAKLYMDGLIEEVSNRFSLSPQLQTSRDVVEFFARSTICDVETLFVIARCALGNANYPKLAQPEREPVAAAAAALYCLAACRLVDKVICEAHLTATGGANWLIELNDVEPVLCAIIATAITGCKLKLVQPPDELISKRYQMPLPEHYFHIGVPGGWEVTAENFERALYQYLIDGKKIETDFAQNEGPLNRDERALLSRVVKEFSVVDKVTLVITVDPKSPLDAPRLFAEANQILVFVENSAAATAIFGIPIYDLRSHIGVFWEKLKAAGQSGKRSAAQVGSGHSANTGEQPGITPQAFEAMVRELTEAIGQTREEEQAWLMSLIRMIEEEVNKPAKSEHSAGFIKRLLENIGSGSEGLENGSKIIAICNRVYQAVGPLFGLPQSPLP